MYLTTVELTLIPDLSGFSTEIATWPSGPKVNRLGTSPSKSSIIIGGGTLGAKTSTSTEVLELTPPVP